MPANTRLCEELVPLLQESFPGQTCEFLGDPFEDYEKITIGDRNKRDYNPRSRVHFRWGLFQHFNETIAEPAFMRGVTIGIVPRYGYDLVAGALAYDFCELSLEIHKMLVKRCIRIRPLYFFTEGLRAQESLVKVSYFDAESGQRFCNIDPGLSRPEKAHQIVRLTQAEYPQLEHAHAA